MTSEARELRIGYTISPPLVTLPVRSRASFSSPRASFEHSSTLSTSASTAWLRTPFACVSMPPSQLTSRLFPLITLLCSCSRCSSDLTISWTFLSAFDLGLIVSNSVSGVYACHRPNRIISFVDHFVKDSQPLCFATVRATYFARSHCRTGKIMHKNFEKFHRFIDGHRTSLLRNSVASRGENFGNRPSFASRTEMLVYSPHLSRLSISMANALVASQPP